jgi:hypothetical protein
MGCKILFYKLKGPYQKNMLELIKEYKLELIPQFDEGKNVLENVGKRYYYEGNISNLKMFSKLDGEEKPELDLVWEKLDKMAENINLKELYKSENAEEYDHITGFILYNF